MKDYLRIIGDVHGCMTKRTKCTRPRNKGKYYLQIANAAEWSIQIGDMGFDYSGMDNLDSNKHRFFGGNHDNYDMINRVPHNLGDFGIIKVGGLSFFFVRGAFSIDKAGRLYNRFAGGYKSWWKQEELTYAEGKSALALYTKTKPDFVITHTCPEVAAVAIGNPEVLSAFGHNPDTFYTNTQRLLQAMYEVHQPKTWVFGHFHKNWEQTVEGTRFICIDELNYITLDEQGSLYV